jgi:thiol-disulfide isomerase/thioredoxin/outer membrane lipoprotein-sorting protein
MSYARSTLLALIVSAPHAWAQVQFNPYSKTAPLHSAAEVLEKAIQALDGVKSMEYEVRILPASPNTSTDPMFASMYAGRTTVLGTVGAPIRYRARFQSDEPHAVVLAVSNGDVVRISSDGELREFPTRTMEDNASAAALPTLQLFDAARYRQALAAKNAIYAGQDDIEGDLCYVVVLSAPFNDEIGSDTFYYWISARTGLPRSRQSFRIGHGKTAITHRWIVSNIRLNPEITDDTFRYRPTLADSTPAAPPARVGLPDPISAIALAGERIPDLEARGRDYEPVSLANAVAGKATIVTLWATWCGPCVAEMPAFQKLMDRYPGKLQVIALLVNDSLLASLNFIKKHPEYRFTYLTDPNLEDSHSKIAQFFVGEGVPRNVFVGPDGKIADYVLGTYASREDQLLKKVDQWLK